jgi:hypothetical protein
MLTTEQRTRVNLIKKHYYDEEFDQSAELLHRISKLELSVLLIDTPSNKHFHFSRWVSKTIEIGRID